MTTTLFVKNLPKDWAWLNTFRYLDTQVRIAVTRVHKLLKRDFALVELAEQQDAQEAIALLRAKGQHR